LPNPQGWVAVSAESERRRRATSICGVSLRQGLTNSHPTDRPPVTNRYYLSLDKHGLFALLLRGIEIPSILPLSATNSRVFNTDSAPTTKIRVELVGVKKISMSKNWTIGRK